MAQVTPLVVHPVLTDLIAGRLGSVVEQDSALLQHAPVLFAFLKPRLSRGALDADTKALLSSILAVALAATEAVTPEEYQRSCRQRVSTPAPLPTGPRPPEFWSITEAMLRTGACSMLRQDGWQPTELGGSDVHRPLGAYVANSSKPATVADAGTCTKNKRNTAVLMPGVLLIWCRECQRCVHFATMRDAESPATVFEVLFTRWQVAPLTVVYDNACNLHNYCLNREPLFFQNTRFLCDEPHWKGHKHCCPAYNSGRYADIGNCSLAEQKNSFVRLLETQALFMGQLTYLRILRHFLYRLNQQEGRVERGECFWRRRRRVQ